MIAGIIITILSICLIISIVGNYNLIKQAENREEYENELDTVLKYYRDAVDTVRERLLQTQTRLIEIDIRGSFEADDEVGFVFKDIKSSIEELNQTVQTV